MPDSSDSGQNGTLIRRSKAGRSPTPSSHSPSRLSQSARRRFGRGYSGRGPIHPPLARQANVRFLAHNTRSVRVGRPARRVSVKDVAARSGVSFQTTSKVLNGGGSVSEATRTRILKVAADLGYVPNLQARSLVMQRSRTVGVITSDFSDHNLGRFIVGAEREARRQGYTVVLTSMQPEGSGTEYALPAMMERRVDGILLAAPQMEEDEALAPVLGRTLPAVRLYAVPGGGVSTVGSDDELTGVLATRHLVEKGRRVIAPVIGTRGRRVTESRMRG